MVRVPLVRHKQLWTSSPSPHTLHTITPGTWVELIHADINWLPDSCAVMLDDYETVLALW